MIRILICLLFLETSFGKESQFDANKYANHWKSIGHSIPQEVHGPRIARAPGGAFGKPGNYITTVIFVDLPSFSDSTLVGTAGGKTSESSIQYSDVQFLRLSSVYSIGYRIDMDANVVQLLLRLGKAQIKGKYSVIAPASTTAGQDFVLNLYANLIYTENIAFHHENGKVSFGETSNYSLLHTKVKGQFTNPPSNLASSLENYLDPKLLEAVVAKIHEEVSQKVSLDDVGFQIKNEIAFRQRNEIVGRLKKALFDAFADSHENLFNVFYHDKTNFKRPIQNFDVTIPTFLLRDVEGFYTEDMKVTFTGNDVHLATKFVITSPLAIFRVVYRDRNDPLAKNRIFKAEYQLFNITCESELIAKPETETVELGDVAVILSDVQVAPWQGLYGDERDIIVQQLSKYAKTYYPENGYIGFLNYIKGLVAEGRITHQVFQ